MVINIIQMEIQDEYLGVKFTDWKKQTIYKNEELNKWSCRLCNKTFNNKTRHKKGLKHYALYNDYEIKRYEYIRNEKNKNN